MPVIGGAAEARWSARSKGRSSSSRGGLCPGLAAARIRVRDSERTSRMNSNRIPRPGELIGRFRLLGPLLMALAGLIVAACNNGGSGSTY
jgi:hypothetical protein